MRSSTARASGVTTAAGSLKTVSPPLGGDSCAWAANGLATASAVSSGTSLEREKVRVDIADSSAKKRRHGVNRQRCPDRLQAGGEGTPAGHAAVCPILSPAPQCGNCPKAL